MTGQHVTEGAKSASLAETAVLQDHAKDEIAQELRYRLVPGSIRWVLALATLAAIALAVNQLFNLRLLPTTILDPQYLYVLSGIFLAMTFIAFPAFAGAPSHRIPWYDFILAAASAGVSGYFAHTAQTSLLQGWEYGAPLLATYLSFVMWALILEGARRTGGLIIFVLVLLFSLYPVVADKMPGPISGFPSPLNETIAFHIISAESSFGIPMRAFGQLVIGFIVFGAALQFTGGGRFFNNLALALVGRFRGGAAKVAIFASGFMGSMSGSVISNVLTTGVVTIPAMKRAGFSARYAAGTEACASTGGTLMPPVMGTTAFIMASFLGRPYVEIAIAAIIPSVLFYFALFVQLDAYAAKRNLKGMPESELPTFRQTFAEGWQYIAVFAVLIFVMIGLRQETLAPFYATALLLIINQIWPSTRLSISGFADLLVSIGRSLAELVALLLAVGMIVGAFSATGLAGTLVNDLVFLAGDGTLTLLIMGAATAFIFGMGMTVTACYIFLAIVLAPALVQSGLDPLAVHLFILYWGMVSFITPPVALGAFAAATIAGVSPMKAAASACVLGSVIYVVPFFFVLNPALIGQGTPVEVGAVFVTALVGVLFIGSAVQGYIAGLGAIQDGAPGYAMRIMLAIGGLALAAPGVQSLGLSNLETAAIALLIAAPTLVVTFLQNRRAVPA